LASSQGRTTVADVVVQKIAGRAAREVSSVHDFVGGASRTFGAITERIPGGRASSSRGVTVEVGEKQAAIDLDIVVEYGVPIGQLAQSIRRNPSRSRFESPPRVTRPAASQPPNRSHPCQRSRHPARSALADDRASHCGRPAPPP
jgi:uncharacterized alkaline shock family protein YloU